MTPLEKIRTGIEEKKWELIVDGYNKLNPTNKVSLPDDEDDDDEDDSDEDDYDDEEIPDRRRIPTRTVQPIERRNPPTRREPLASNVDKRQARRGQVSGGLNLYYDDLSEHVEDIPVIKEPVRRKRQQRKPSKPLPDSISIE